MFESIILRMKKRFKIRHVWEVQMWKRVRMFGFRDKCHFETLLKKMYASGCKLYAMLVIVKCVKLYCFLSASRSDGGKFKMKNHNQNRAHSHLLAWPKWACWTGVMCLILLLWIPRTLEHCWVFSPINWPFRTCATKKKTKQKMTSSSADKWIVEWYVINLSQHLIPDIFFFQYSIPLTNWCQIFWKKHTLGWGLSCTLDLCFTLWLSLSLLCCNIWSQLDSIRAQTSVKIPPGGFCSFGTLLAKPCH